MPNNNTFNYTLTDFFVPVGVSPRYNFDYVIQGKNLYALSNSLLLANTTSLSSSSTTALSSLYLTGLTALDTVWLDEPSLTNFSTISTITSLTAYHIGLSSLAISAASIPTVYLSGSWALTGVNLSRAFNIGTITFTNCKNLSSITWSTPNVSAFTTVQFLSTNINTTSLDTFWTSLCSLCAGAPGRLTNRLAITVQNPVTGSGITTWASLTALSNAGATINYSITNPAYRF